MFYIYSIKSLETGKVYIGSRTNKVMLNRKPEDDLGVKYFSSSKDKELRRAIKDCKVKYTILQEYDDPKICWNAEQQLIALYWKFFGKENSYNHNYTKCTGEKVWSTAGISPSEESKKKNSDAHKGEKHPLYGKHHTEETLKKIGEARNEYNKTHDNPFKGKHHSEETLKKIGESHKGEKNPWFGKHLPEKIRKKMSEAHKGKHHSEETCQKLSDMKKGKPRKMYYWKTPFDEIKIMAKFNAKRWHPDWTFIGPVE